VVNFNNNYEKKSLQNNIELLVKEAQFFNENTSVFVELNKQILLNTSNTN